MDISLLATDKVFQRPQVRISPTPSVLQLVMQNEFGWDIELSNRCNAQCYFCPREVLSKFGNMSLENIRLTIDRIAEVSPRGTLIGACGHGEPLLNPHVVEFIQYGHDRGFRIGMVSNGGHLKSVPPEALIDAGLSRIVFSISEIGQAYTDMYKLPFDDVLRGVRRFRDYAKGKCHISINFVVTEKTKPRSRILKDFWRSEGIEDFDHFPVINRGGDVAGKNERYLNSRFRNRSREIVKEHGFSNLCWKAIFAPFVGWDGSYYLCCNDWSKRHKVGHVRDTTWREVIANRIDLMNSKKSICNTCDFNIYNRIVDCLESDSRAENTIIPELIKDRQTEEHLMQTFLSKYMR